MIRPMLASLFAVLAAGAQIIPRLPQPAVKYAATPQSVVDAMLALARVTPADIVYDLGSGDGRIPITAATKYGARAVGIEIDPFYLRSAYDNLKKAGVGDRVRFLNQDFFAADIHEATVVTLFLLPQVNQRLMAKLKRELQPGVRIVSHLYDMGDEWPPDRSQEADGAMIYLWMIRREPALK
jgi:cyclopropane fatty-acyl-phospholipid synthase-like methyltransferase